MVRILTVMMVLQVAGSGACDELEIGGVVVDCAAAAVVVN